MATGNVIRTPPVLPVRRSPVVTAPPKPPALPGKVIGVGVIAPPRKPQAETREQEAARRVAALADTEYADPKSTGEMLALGLKNSAKAIPLLVKKYWLLIIIILGLWLFLMTYNPIALSMKYPSLRGLFAVITPVVGILVFFTAAYNNWVAKSIYAVVVVKIIVPLVQRIRAEGFNKVVKSFSSVAPGLKSNWAESGAWALMLFVMSSGVGIAFSNFLTRNNKSDKCLVSIALAISLVKVLSDGSKTMPFMTTRVIGRDIFKLFKRNSPMRNHHIYLCIGGLMIGLAGAIVLALGAMVIGDNIQFVGYILGGIAVATGVALYFVKVRTKTAQ